MTRPCSRQAAGIRRTWRRGDRVALTFDMRCRVTTLNGEVALSRGSVVLSLDNRLTPAAAGRVTLGPDPELIPDPTTAKKIGAWMAFDVGAQVLRSRPGGKRLQRDEYFPHLAAPAPGHGDTVRYRPNMANSHPRLNLDRSAAAPALRLTSLGACQRVLPGFWSLFLTPLIPRSAFDPKPSTPIRCHAALKAANTGGSVPSPAILFRKAKGLINRMVRGTFVSLTQSSLNGNCAVWLSRKYVA